MKNVTVSVFSGLIVLFLFWYGGIDLLARGVDSAMSLFLSLLTGLIVFLVLKSV